MNSIAEALLLLDGENDLDGMIRYAQDGSHAPNDMVHAVYQLLVSGGFRPAFIIAMLLANAGHQNPVAAMALAVGGMVFGNAEEESRGLTSLQAHLDFLNAEQSASFYTSVMEPVIKRLLESALRTSDNDLVLRILKILKAGAPRFRTILDLDAAAPALTLEELRRRGRERSRLITYPSPPATAPRQARRAMVAVRELFFPNHPRSRPMDLGPRLVAAMENYGWQTGFFGIQCANLMDDYKNLAEACIAQETELLILDDNLIEAEYALPARAEMIAHLRRELPSLKVVSILFDTWILTPAAMTDALASVDCVWEATSPSLPLWQEPAFAGKLLHMQIPHAGAGSPPVLPLNSSVSFCGGVKGYNWHRAFWLAGADSLKLPIEQRLSSHMTDGLPPLESYAVYMRQLSEAPCSLNLSMRSDQTCIVTGRCFETIFSGSLLLQEATPDMDYYFTAGEHYLEFSTMAELSAIVRFITTNRDEAEEIRRCGNAFARERYSDDMLIGYLDRKLFFPA
jgi:hypothetical protein